MLIELLAAASIAQVPSPQGFSAAPAPLTASPVVYAVEYRPGLRLRLPWERTARPVLRPAHALVTRIEAQSTILPFALPAPVVAPAPVPMTALPPLPPPAKIAPIPTAQDGGNQSLERVLGALQSIERRLDEIERRDHRDPSDWTAAPRPPAPPK